MLMLALNFFVSVNTYFLCIMGEILEVKPVFGGVLTIQAQSGFLAVIYKLPYL